MAFILCPQTFVEHLLCVESHSMCYERWRDRPFPTIWKGTWMITKATRTEPRASGNGLLSPRQLLSRPHLDHCVSALTNAASFSTPFPTLCTLYMVRRCIKSKFFCLVFQGHFILVPVTFSLTGINYPWSLGLVPNRVHSPHDNSLSKYYPHSSISSLLIYFFVCSHPPFSSFRCQLNFHFFIKIYLLWVPKIRTI